MWQVRMPPLHSDEMCLTTFQERRYKYRNDYLPDRWIVWIARKKEKKKKKRERVGGDCILSHNQSVLLNMKQNMKKKREREGHALMV